MGDCACNLNGLINKPTCFESNNPRFIDLILTNRKNLFKLSSSFEITINHLRLFWNQEDSKERFYDNCHRGKLPPTTKLTLTQTLIPTGGNFPQEQLSCCSPALKLTLILTQTPTLTRGNFLLGAIVRIPKGTPKIKVYKSF